jgi:transcriptional regulator with XRE-family HTH domain
MSGLDLKIARIKQVRKQLEVARQTGIHPTRLSKIENGWEQPRDSEILAILAALKLDEHQPNQNRPQSRLEQRGQKDKGSLPDRLHESVK